MDRDNVERKFKVQNGDNVDLYITRSDESNVSDEDFKIILEKNFKSNYSLFKEIVRRFIYTNLLKCIWIKLLLILSN